MSARHTPLHLPQLPTTSPNSQITELPPGSFDQIIGELQEMRWHIQT